MMRSIFESYMSCAVLAAVGYGALGGNLVGWLTFIWIFGAVLTVLIAYLPASPSSLFVLAK